MRQPVTAIDIRRDLVGLLPKLRRFAMALTGDAASADDLLLAVCQRAITRSHLWNGEGRLESWIYTMARHQWVDEARKRKVRANAGKGSVVEHMAHDAAHEKSVDAGEIHEMIASMPEGLACTFILVDVEGHDYKHTAEILGVSIGTVASQLAAARALLAKIAEESPARRY
ncbi:RNA polymerase sigma factor [Rhizobium sp. BK251]|uniref:RNA polymerase sigma factor n=1 Tax=Rhizobium sp. BK251 TaxID=2512125 RepID=UPI00104F0B62|nr:RNA polymerase sigma factor [Rhizobium sp. BK251]TCL74725.1 RNA polymerase sigma-70 factor (ECF subfamily) [Rhizobium sp. BK251]